MRGGMWRPDRASDNTICFPQRITWQADGISADTITFPRRTTWTGADNSVARSPPLMVPLRQPSSQRSSARIRICGECVSLDRHALTFRLQRRNMTYFYPQHTVLARESIYCLILALPYRARHHDKANALPGRGCSCLSLSQCCVHV